ncbi:MAG: type VII toxin-antitoxin system HepT family RNase toxin, partial [Fusobacteriota bacterium]
MKDDIVLNKIETIKRCINRVEEEYENNPKNLKIYRRQDSIILNIQRLCEASIDLANHYIKEKGMGIPQKSREAFEILGKNEIITEKLENSLSAMVGFRNIAVHDYQSLNLDIVKAIIEKHIYDGLDFG